MSPDVKTVARRATRRAHDLYARATHDQRSLPTFLIIGGQRCGTTTLFKALAQHPGVLGANLRKGVHYFDLHYDRPLSWYRSHFPTKRQANALAAEHGYKTNIGESSPYYLWHPLAASRIAADLPDVRLLVLLRDPAERAYSAHAHERARGFENETFERALDLEESRIAGEAERLAKDPAARSTSHQHHAYVARGQYIEQLEQVEKQVGRDRMLVVDSQDFWSQPETIWPSVTDSLALPPDPVSFQQHNARSRSTMSEDLRDRLSTHYESFDERLASWWGRTPSWRR